MYIHTYIHTRYTHVKSAPKLRHMQTHTHENRHPAALSRRAIK